jgi:hypothetical protein
VVTPGQTLAFALVLGGIGLVLLYAEVNPLTMWLTLATFLGYVNASRWSRRDPHRRRLLGTRLPRPRQWSPKRWPGLPVLPADPSRQAATKQRHHVELPRLRPRYREDHRVMVLRPQQNSNSFIAWRMEHRPAGSESLE